MLSKQTKLDDCGVCYMFNRYTFKIVGESIYLTFNSYSSALNTHWRRMTAIWVASSAVPSSDSTFFPVKADKIDSGKAYEEAARYETMWEGKYGENRTEFLNFASDYIEETLK